MKKFEAINYYVNSYDLVDTEIINAIIGKPNKIKLCFDKTNPKDLEKLKIYIKQLKLL
jgi:hypothetical protein